MTSLRKEKVNMEYVELYLEKLNYYSDVQLDGPKIIGLSLCFVADAISKGLSGKHGVARAIGRFTDTIENIYKDIEYFRRNG